MANVQNQSIDHNRYLNRFCSEQQFIHERVKKDIGIIVVIPSYAEKELNKTIKSLVDCEPSGCHTEVIIVINDHKNSTEQEQLINNDGVQLVKNKSDESFENLSFHLIELRALESKNSGVGVARKTGMDEAVRRFGSINKNGVIVCLDGDCEVSTNYLREIEDHFFAKHPECTGSDIYFEHPLRTREEQLKKGIILYELHLRYYVQCQEYCNCPYAFHTVGSSMAVRSEAYQKQGGMNKRKAGEDFYFLHKIIALENFKSITSATVYPSPRVSHRVPFGTGKTQYEFQKNRHFSTYNFNSFLAIKEFTSQFVLLYEGSSELNVDPTIRKWLNTINFDDKIEEIKRNTNGQNAFHKRLWSWFNAFQFMKLTHYLRDHSFPNVKIEEACVELLRNQGQKIEAGDTESLLRIFRSIDKKKAALKRLPR